MSILSRFSFVPASLIAAFLFLAGCSPTFDWREVHGAAPAPFTVLLPAKPSTLTRPLKLGDVSTTMTMTAAEVDGITFAVGSAELPNATQATSALADMKAALVQNIHGQVRKEKTSTNGIEVEALSPSANGKPPRLFLAHFVARERRVYQVVLLGPEHAIQKETVEMFFTSFKPN